jgi:3-oxoacyl-[acyl-carrier protein] reductase
MADTRTLERARSNGGVRTREGCALVTGASRGLGAAIAAALARDGWPVAINFHTSHESAERVAAGIAADGGEAILAQADIKDPASIDPLFDELEDRFGRVLVLVNNAGVRADSLSPQISDDAWERVLETNLSGAFRATRRALRPMIRARFGRIVNVASVIGQRANPGQANYAAAKAGLVAFTKTVAVEVARRGVTVNAVAPGLIETDMTQDLAPDLGATIPARRAGRPGEVAACVRFLASEDAAYVTGALLAVDGGLSA